MATACFLPLWHFLVFLTYALGWTTLSLGLVNAGMAAAFFIGLAWAVFYVERNSRQRQDARRSRSLTPAATTASTARGAEKPLGAPGPLEAMSASAAPPASGERVWHPLDLDACYYGKRKRKLNQSLATISCYGLLFFLAVALITQLTGCHEIYEMPAGGGEEKPLKQVVKVQKIIRRKFVINPFSAIIFNPPKIEEVKLQLLELTEHTYQVGAGAGAGAGFSAGTNRGKVRFIRLQYGGGDWDQDIGSDLNMLVEYGVRTSHKIAPRPETRKVAQLKNFPVGKAPPFVFMTGQRNIHLSRAEQKILSEYLLEKHGMIIADNGGSGHWHRQFFDLMRRVLPHVEPVRVPLDHPVHQVPYPIPFLPYVAPHGGKDAWGWVVDGRLAAYYHPGDIGDAWADGHAGVKPEIWEACYQLGCNLIFYAHAQYNRWLSKQEPDGEG